MDVKFYIAVGMSTLLAAGMLGSLIVTMKPAGRQNQSLLALVITTSVLTGLIGWIFGYIYFKGNPVAQIQFLLFFTFILFVTCTTSATVAASQLYGIRDAIAVKNQGLV